MAEAVALHLVVAHLDHELGPERGLRQLDKRRGYRRPKRNVLAEGRTIDNFKDDRWTRPMSVGDVVPAVVVALGKPAAGARLRIGSLHADLTAKGFA